MKFITYIYIHFNQNVDEKSDINAKLKQENINTHFSANSRTYPKAKAVYR